MEIGFLLGSPDISGGTNVIFEHASRLQLSGHQVTILTEIDVDPSRYFWHPQASLLRWKSIDSVSGDLFDFIIATWWQSVFHLSRLRSCNFVYFVQSIESRFFPVENPEIMGLRDINVLADWCENTYRYPLHVITEASWIKKYLYNHFNQEAQLTINGIRKDLFSLNGIVLEKRKPGVLRVLVEGPLCVFYKNVERTIALCLEAQVDEIWLLTSSDISFYPGVNRCFSKIPINKTAEIYRSCDVLVKLSHVEGMFGPPLEMFHCGGTAIVFDVSGHEEYIENGKNAIVVNRENEDEVISWLKRLKREPKLLNDLKNAAKETAENWPDWDIASARFEEALLRCGKLKEEREVNYLEEHNSHFIAVRENAFCERSLKRLAERESASQSSSFVNFIQVYCDCGSGIIEELSDRYETGDWAMCRVQQKNIVSPVRIRIDPSVRIGIVSIRSIRIFGGTSHRLIASWKKNGNWEDIFIMGTAICLQNKEYLVLEAYGEDPQLVLPDVTIPEGDTSITIEIEVKEIGFIQALKQCRNEFNEKSNFFYTIAANLQKLKSVVMRNIEDAWIKSFTR